MEKQFYTMVYDHKMRPSHYDEGRFICYLNEKPADYTFKGVSGENSEKKEPVPGYSYTGPMCDGGTLIDCDEWNRDKLIEGIIRTRYSSTVENAIKTHRLNVLAEKVGLSAPVLSAEKTDEYEAEWEAFEQFRTEVISLVDTWDSWK